MNKGMAVLDPLPKQDAYATDYFFGIIYGPDFYVKTTKGHRPITDEELKELILTRLKMSYDLAVEKVEAVYR